MASVSIFISAFIQHTFLMEVKSCHTAVGCDSPLGLESTGELSFDVFQRHQITVQVSFQTMYSFDPPASASPMLGF